MLSKKLLTHRFNYRIARINVKYHLVAFNCAVRRLYQLPPVGDDEDEDTSAFCFESESWAV